MPSLLLEKRTHPRSASFHWARMTAHHLLGMTSSAKQRASVSPTYVKPLSGRGAVTKGQVRVENLRANLPAQPSARLVLKANCPVANTLVEAESTTEEVVAEAQASEGMETTGSVAPH